MNIPRFRSIIVVAAAAIAGVVLGTTVRSAITRTSDEKPAQGPATPEQAPAPPKVVSALDDRVPEEERRTARSLALAPRPKRLLWFASRAENADAKEMASLMRLAGSDYAVKMMLAARWAELDPEKMFDALVRSMRDGADYDYQVFGVLMKSWAKTDPSGLIAALDNSLPFAGLEGARMSASDILMRQDPEYGLSVLEKWGIRSYIPRMTKVAEWAKRDPLAAAERVANIDADYAGLEALGAVARAWADTDPAAALEFAATLRAQKQSTFAQKAMEIWAKNDPETAVEFATGQDDPNFRGLIGSGLLAEWAKSDPAAALQWGAEHLDSPYRTTAIEKVIESVSRKDPLAAAELLHSIGSSGTKLKAATKLLETWIEESDNETRTSAIEWLASLPDHKFASSVLESARWRFAHSAPDSILEIAEGQHSHLVNSRLLYDVAGDQVRKSPQGALEWASGLPPDRAADAESAVILNWVKIQPESATEWAMSLAGTEQRRLAIEALAKSFTHRPVTGLKEWLQRLEGDERRRAIDIVADSKANAEKKAQISAIISEL